ncbi:MAG TPA: amidohydrolase family protein [Acidimicrobiales bacterium]|nr:amidohydrolase family protein [Acidimicrobiales bacterium]
MAGGTEVIDADGHVLEPRAAWAGLPERHRPTIGTDPKGLDHVTVGGHEVFTARLGQMGTPGTDVGAPADAVPLEDAREGAFDPRARLVDMDAEGIDRAVLYPTVGLGFWGIPDPEAAVAVARAYNDWLAGYCATAPLRLHGAAMVPLQDPGAAVAELTRARRELGFVSAFVRPNPCGGRSIVDPAHEPLWEAAAGLGVAVAVHEGFQPAVPPLGHDRRPTNVLVLHAISHTLEQMLACAQLIGTGVLERHPDLRVVFLEAGGGWAPYWVSRLDHQVPAYHRFAPSLSLLPSEYFSRQCWVSFEIDEETLPALVPFLGPDRVVWGSDYPHADSTFPGAVAELRRTIAPLTEGERAKILGANAARLYGL